MQALNLERNCTFGELNWNFIIPTRLSFKPKLFRISVANSHMTYKCIKHHRFTQEDAVSYFARKGLFAERSSIILISLIIFSQTYIRLNLVFGGGIESSS